MEGFYRVSGQTSEVLCVKEKYDDGEYTFLFFPLKGQINVPAYILNYASLYLWMICPHL